MVNVVYFVDVATAADVVSTSQRSDVFRSVDDYAMALKSLPSDASHSARRYRDCCAAQQLELQRSVALL